MSANSTTTEDAVFESDVVNSTEVDPIDQEPAEGDQSEGEASEPAIDENEVVEIDQDESENDDSDLDEIEEADLESSDDEVSDLDEPPTFGELYGQLFKGDPYNSTNNDYTEEEADTEELKEEKLKKIVNYIDKCNSDQHFIVKMHTKSIYDLEPLPEEPSAFQLGRFTDKLVLHVWVLQMLDPQDVDRWSGLLVHLISNKLDPTTRSFWNTFAWNYKISEHGKNVTMSAMLEFLRYTCREYEIRGPSRSFGCKTCIFYNNLNPKVDTPKSTLC
ncbi:unnamed protein product [Macrosiphum euphorbiae]|uniref:Uncharacterized protein n=1 Tax=Macrosiphum euphorbiae TaxID=13131 RepID=A0AAV0VYB0_9HEMI|nr:unnamed protein product [Macrosiphum euphorbiae]